MIDRHRQISCRVRCVRRVQTGLESYNIDIQEKTPQQPQKSFSLSIGIRRDSMTDSLQKTLLKTFNKLISVAGAKNHDILLRGLLNAIPSIWWPIRRYQQGIRTRAWSMRYLWISWQTGQRLNINITTRSIHGTWRQHSAGVVISVPPSPKAPVT